MLLTIVAVLTIGFTGCSDELSGDQTKGKPGYLTVNVKTLKTRASKTPGAVTADYELMKDLNVFIFDGTAANNKLQQKYVSGTLVSPYDISMQVGTLPGTAKVVVVANYGSAITGVNTYAELVAKEIETVRDFSTLGLHMTGEANISGTGTYESYVNVAPVESKITVNWTLAQDAANYVVTGVYVVNAINKTTLPIIRQRTYVTDWTAAASDIAISSMISAGTRTASCGLTPVTGRDYNFYTGMTDLSATSDTYLKDLCNSFTSNVDSTYMTTDADSLNGVIGLHYYVGENYHANLPAANGGNFITNASANANTIVVVRVTPKSDAPTYIKQMGHKYYTYDFSKNSSLLNAVTASITEGFSVRRKTNYKLNFALTSIGASNPFVKLNTLTVHVTAEGWNDGGNVPF
ncbi:MAG: hypothetical protein H6Q16_371 [Bacteroidetes bacterium]|nr:hypothetical protein [Bacteroidota bacterium]